MGDLRDLLELLHCAHERVRSLRVEFSDWFHPPPSNTLVVDREDLRAGRLRWLGGGPWPRPSETKRRIWFERPDCRRVELLDNHVLVRLGVSDGSTWWRWDQADGETAGIVTSPEGLRTLPPLLDPPLLSPARLLATLRLEPTGVGVRAGREVLRARAWPRRPARSDGAVSYELEFDAEHGTLLRRSASAGDRCFEVTEALEISYECDIDPRRFVFAAPAGQQTRRAHMPQASHKVRERMAEADRNGRLRSGRLNRRARTVWLTGLPAAGKTTLALAVERELTRMGLPTCVLDGDELRKGLSSDLGLSPADRAEQARRAAHAATMISRSGVTAIVALVSPYAEDRRRARRIHDEHGVPFFEVWVDTSLDVCEQRDPKGLYARARAGELVGLTGVDAPYEPPKTPDLPVIADDEDPKNLATRIVELLFARQPGIRSQVEQPTSEAPAPSRD